MNQKTHNARLEKALKQEAEFQREVDKVLAKVMDQRTPEQKEWDDLQPVLDALFEYHQPMKVIAH